MSKSKISRRFLGKIEGFENKEERDFETKHLRAYLKGNDNFRHGFHMVEYLGLKLMLPKYHDVKQEIITL